MIYYTGSTTPGGESSMIKSLGGYISSTQVPSGIDNSLFSNVAKSELKFRETKLIVFQAPVNVTEIEISGQDFEGITFDFALVEPLYDSVCDKYYFPQILSSRELPLGVTFEALPNADTDPPVVIPITLLSGKYVGIWLIRKPFAQEYINSLGVNNKNNQTCTTESLTALRTIEEDLLVKKDFQLNLKYSN